MMTDIMGPFVISMSIYFALLPGSPTVHAALYTLCNGARTHKTYDANSRPTAGWLVGYGVLSSTNSCSSMMASL